MLRNGPFLEHIRLFVAIIAGCVTILFTYGNGMAQTAETTVALSGTVTSTVSAPQLIFSTPPPVREEEALTSGFRNVPSVFPGVDDYHAIRAQRTLSSILTSEASKPIDAVQSVVQIFRCDQFGCDTPVGTGVIIHPSGLILTAYHVLLENPNNLRSQEYDDFVIALTENPRTPPRPLYRARSVADLDELDIALLAIDRDVDEEPIDAETLNLTALPFADVDQLFADTLHVLGFPLDGGDAVNYTPATFASFDDNGQLIVVDKDLSSGNSGGPALVLQSGRLAIAGLVIRGRTTQGRLGQDGLLRAIDQVSELGWTPDFGRALGQDVLAGVGTVVGEEMLQLSLDLSIYDRVDDTLRLLFYVVESGTGQPWQPEEADGPLVIWADLAPTDFVDAQQVALTIPVDDLGIAPDQLTFFGMLWDRENGESMWASTEGVQVSGHAIVMVSDAGSADEKPEESEVEPTPIATRTPTLSPTKTPRSIATPTPDNEATEEAIETATAKARTPTATPRPTATSTPKPTSTSTSTPTRTMTPTPEMPKAGEMREFGGIPFVYVPAGEFLMGSSDQDDEAYDHEKPQHTVDLDAYWIMQTEVTNAQYGACVAADECRKPDNEQWNHDDYSAHPVTDVSWKDVVSYADWLSAATAQTLVLPTEAQWEKAARGTEGRIYPWGDAWDPTLVNYCDRNCEYDGWKDEEGDDGYARTAPVGSYPDGASPYGALEMAGNVWEWTADWYDSGAYKGSPDRNPTGPYRVVRGGAWFNSPSDVRAAYRGRDYALANIRDGYMGFRLASPGF